ncbi:hypothetical protein PYCCODRAFT_214142 [Trametes coccinea BRFM310]|uniref:Uncharacterized protein n=1 Tax=Trametes coccinea (strain BRFM310) TaxID=1353009 RepID=A0A1Y2IQM5_TRAC3|nr:hypothetical protein PYCCODRAFT_214142 [Trametes coccinea BRFM310]
MRPSSFPLLATFPPFPAPRPSNSKRLPRSPLYQASTVLRYSTVSALPSTSFRSAILFSLHSSFSRPPALARTPAGLATRLCVHLRKFSRDPTPISPDQLDRCNIYQLPRFGYHVLAHRPQPTFLCIQRCGACSASRASPVAPGVRPARSLVSCARIASVTKCSSSSLSSMRAMSLLASIPPPQRSSKHGRPPCRGRTSEWHGRKPRDATASPLTPQRAIHSVGLMG